MGIGVWALVALLVCESGPRTTLTRQKTNLYMQIFFIKIIVLN